MIQSHFLDASPVTLGGRLTGEPDAPVGAGTQTWCVDTTEPEQRPSLEPGLTESELRRWYWLRAELVVLARELGTSTAGSKEELTARIADVLAGRRPRPPTRRERTRQLTGPLDSATE